MFAKLQFLEYYITSMEYRSNPFKSRDDDQETITLKPEFDYDMKFKDDDLSEALIELSVMVGDRELNESSFFATASVAGIFQLVDSDMQKDDKFKYYKVNALAILFPYLRSIISDITSKGAEVPLILPTINVVALFKKIDSDKKQKEKV